MAAVGGAPKGVRRETGRGEEVRWHDAGVEPKEAKRLLDAGRARLIDVRSEPEARLERIPGSALVPLAGFRVWAAGREPEPVILYCSSGRRSERALRHLRDDLGWL